MTAIVIKTKRQKSFNEISIQCERIFTLHISKGFGTDKMFDRCESIYLKLITKFGY